MVKSPSSIAAFNAAGLDLLDADRCLNDLLGVSLPLDDSLLEKRELGANLDTAHLLPTCHRSLFFVG